MIHGFLALLLSAQAATSAGRSWQDQIKADAALRRAWEGRSATIETICGDELRRQRVIELDLRLTTILDAYGRSFQHSWAGQSDDGGGRVGAPSTDPTCRGKTGFYGALSEYENGINMAQATIDR